MAKAEKNVAQAMLQEPLTVTLGGVDYEAAQPTIGTLLAASAYICDMPERIELKEGEELQCILGRAVEFAALPRILATLIVGVHGRRKVSSEQPKNGFMARLLGRYRPQETEIDRMERVISDTASPKEVTEALVTLLGGLQLQDFFVCTTFLTGIRVTKPTREVEKKTATGATARGQ